MIDILNEFILLFIGDSKKIENLNIEPYIENSNTTKNMWNKYIYYFRISIKILIKENRMLYFGIFLIFMSIILLLSNN